VKKAINAKNETEVEAKMQELVKVMNLAQSK